MFKSLLISVRPKQWYKNLLLFVSIIFSFNIDKPDLWVTLILAFICFCLLSSSEYLINDVIDRKRDKIHPVKSKRPIASGQLKVIHAVIIALFLMVISLTGAYFINLEFFIITACYLALILLYSILLKKFIFIDVLIISTGFVVRAVAGGFAIDVKITMWLIVCTFLLALFIALNKRWQEVTLLAENAESHRSNLSEYTARMLEQLINITTGALIVSYILYLNIGFSIDFDYKSNLILITVPFVIYGLFRYIYLVHKRGYAADPEEIFKDKPTVINLVIWVSIILAVILYEMR
ncbi:MAG: decaprenyl-phosphate phosphoribosyltransferase [Chloroflexi bacterium]|nr:decaprenyl-phosphate phosphoribosyltransferase [Chloroflexota bacterium]